MADVERTLMHLDREALSKMTVGDLAMLIEKYRASHPGVKFNGTAEVIRADGTVKYDKAPDEPVNV